MFDFSTRWSTRLFVGAAASGALSYLHGFCGAVLEELGHRGFSSWLGSTSFALFMVAALLMIWGVMMLSAEQRYSSGLPAQSSHSPQQLSAQVSVPLDVAPDAAERLRI